MASKSVVLWFCVLTIMALASCTSGPQAAPTVDQKSISTAIAATINAAATSTQRAISTIQPLQTITLSPVPTQAETTDATAGLPSPTVAIPTGAGQRIAYTKNGDVYLWSTGHDPLRLTDMHDVVTVRLSGDGSLIAFKRQNPDDVTQQELWVVNSEGTPNPRILVSAGDLAALLPANPDQSILGAGILDFTWGPNTHIVAYNTLVLHIGPGFGPRYDLRLIDADSLEKTTLFEAGEAGLFYYSRDGSQIALSNPESISLVNADGTHLRKDVLTFPDVITYSEYQYHPHPTWGDDSLSLGIAIPPHDPMADPLPPTVLWSIPVDGQPPTELSQVPAMPFVWPDNAFSPNLEDVVYIKSVGASTDNQRELHLARPDGSSDVSYDQGESLAFLSWAPNSQHFIYQINSGPKKGVYLGGLVSQPKLIIFDPQVISDIKWLGSNRLVFPFQDGTEWLLFIQNPDDGELDRVDVIPDSIPSFDVLP